MATTEYEQTTLKPKYKTKLSKIISGKHISRKQLEKQVGSIPNTGDSVEEVREIRKKSSKEKVDLDEINKE
jgi:hypothetical protein